MKVKTLSALAGVGAAMIMSNGAQAANFVVISQNTTNTFLVANNLQSAVVGITGFVAGEQLQGVIGTTANPWTVTCSSGSFFNVASTFSTGGGVQFDGNGQAAASSLVAQPGSNFDSGVLSTASGLGAASGNPGTNPIGFAQFGVGQNSGPMAPVSMLSLNPSGVAPGLNFGLFRLTWSRAASATVAMRIVTNTGGGNGFEYGSSVTIPAVPAPGALALLGVAGLVGSRRRRA